MNGEATVRLVGVRRVFGHGPTAVEAVRSVDLRVSPGEVVAIMGPSGSGKSTLLSLIAGLLEPTSGEVFLCGRSLKQLKEKERARLRRRLIGFVFQNFNLLSSLTARENVEVSLHLAGQKGPVAHDEAARALAVLGLGDRLDFLPKQLSGGQQQRVALARALAPSPRLILADEPTGNLDSAAGRAVLEIICTHAHQNGAAAVVVSHDLRVRQMVDRCLWMEDGVISEALGDAAEN